MERKKLFKKKKLILYINYVLEKLFACVNAAIYLMYNFFCQHPLLSTKTRPAAMNTVEFNVF